MLYLNKVVHKSPVDPPFLGDLFTSPVFAVVWLAVRVYVGWQWLEAGLHKFASPDWMETGAALKGFWAGAVAIPAQGKPAITYDWYRDFLTALLNGGHYTWFAKLIVFGEIAIGVALIVGAFVGVAALFGALMNFNFMLAGSASINPMLFILSVLLVLAWKSAGYFGLDYALLPVVRTPWEWGRATLSARPIKAS